MAVGDRVDQFRALARQSVADLFDQRDPFGRLALVQVLMLAGDTLVTISLAGSLFFSISPTEAKSKVFLYLVLTLAPFAIVSPLLGPLIDRSRGARRAMVIFSAVGRAVICPLMAQHIHGLLLFPLAFLILVLSKLFLVTRGALVPEMVTASGGHPSRARPGILLDDPSSPAGAEGDGPSTVDLPGVAHGQPAASGPWPDDLDVDGASPVDDPSSGKGRTAAPTVEYAALNARLTLLGTVAGFVASVPGIILLKLTGAPGVLVFDAFVFAGAAVAGARLPALGRDGGRRTDSAGAPPIAAADAWSTAEVGGGGAWTAETDPDLTSLQPIAHPEVMLGLTTMSLIRGVAGFLIFLLAFGLRREHAALAWYGLALGASGIGALIGLLLVGRLRTRLAEQQILLGSIWSIGGIALAVAFWGSLPAQILLALVVGLAGSLAQPSFDAMTQRFVPTPAQGRAFARFATRQQLVWCVGAMIPVVLTLPFPVGDVGIAATAAAGGAFYAVGRRSLRSRALPRPHRRPG